MRAAKQSSKTVRTFSMKVKDFNLKHTLECGQFFRYHGHSKGYYVQSRDRMFYVEQKGDSIRVKGDVTKRFITRFFRLDDNLDKIKRRISIDRHVAAAVKKYHGLRLIRQDPWECMISYVCSSASNIPKIQKNIELLSREHGKKIQLDHHVSHTFPEYNTMKDLNTINACKVGYRDKFIFEINNRVDERFIDKLKRMDYEDAKKALKSLPGIGDKVADCILLFSLDHLEAFPVDTWIKRVMEKLYFSGRSVSNKEIREFARHYFGKYAGYAQQYLFHHARDNKI